ncbi:hypothetical protein EYR38_002106 [Pleurotus pulmonarius]|nr:hypothetical protein EYR38_002106 [Pleurotus pulmonarius]
MAYTSEDPYNAVQEEIENSLQAARTLCSSYVRIRGYASAEEEKEAREELQTSLDLLEVDLDDLDESVRIVETAEGARSFGLSDAEVQERRQYVRKVKKEIELMRSRLTTSVDQHPLSPSPNSRPSNTASHPLASTSRVHSRAGSLNASLGGSRAASPRPEDDQAEWSRVEQQMLIEQQDRTMDSIAGTLSTLAQQAGLMGREINEHVESDSELADKANAATTSTFVTALVFNVAVFAIQIGLFTLLRPYFKAIYEPRTYVPAPSKRVKPLVPDKGSKTKSALSGFTWPIALWRADYKDIAPANGLDAYFYVRFLRMMVKILLPIWFLSWAVLLPVTSVDTNVEGNEGLNRFIFGNVATNKQERYAAHIIMVFLFTGWIFYVIKHEMRHFVLTRQRHLIDPAHSSSVQANTVLVTGIPSKYLSEDALISLFSHLPGGVKKVWINRDLKELPEIYDRRASACNKLESAETALLKTAAKLRLEGLKKSQKGKAAKDNDVAASGDVERADTSIVPRDQRPRHRLGWIPFKGPKIDTIEWAREEIRICNELLGRGRGAIGGDKSGGRVGISGPRPLSSAESGGAGSTEGAAEGGKVSHVVGQVKSKIPGMGPKPEGEQKENSIGGDPFPVVTSDYPALSSAFITFNRQIAAHMAAQVLTHHAPYRMGSKYLEVAPDDVVWSNLSLNPYEQKVRMLLSYAATAGLILLWSIPVAFVGVISNVGQLCLKFSWLAWLCKLPKPVYGIIAGILPPVLLAVLMMLLPIVLRIFARVEGIPTRSGIELSLMTRFFMFQVIHSFLIITISSGLISAVQDLANNPTSIPTILAQKLPQASIFFLTYIILQGLPGVASGFLQIVPLIIYYVKLIILGSTPRAVYTIKYTCRNVQWGTLFPTTTLLVVITLGYSILAPIINGLACATFFGFYIMYKFLFLWQYQQDLKTDTGGLFFPKAIQHVFVGLYIQQLCLCALFFLARDENGSTSAVPQGALMVVLIIFTALFNIMINQSYGPLLHHLPLTLADKTYNATASLHDESDAGSTAPVTGSEKQNAVTADVRDEDIKADISKNERGVEKSDSRGLTEEDYGFSHPAATRPQRTIWIPQDTLGLGEEEVAGCRDAGVDADCADAQMNEKGKVDISGSPPDHIKEE